MHRLQIEFRSIGCHEITNILMIISSGFLKRLQNNRLQNKLMFLLDAFGVKSKHLKNLNFLLLHFVGFRY
jgi:hypothetical protein